MKQIILSLFILFSAILKAEDQGIQFFHGSFEEAKVKAKKENKIIFIDCYTTWCGPCKVLAKTVFTDMELGKFHNENFINLKLDMEKEGISFGAEYGVSAYPTLYYIDHMGNVKQKLVGGRDAKSLINIGKEAMKPDPSILNKMEERFANGEREKEYLLGYITTLSAAGKSYEVPFREYIDLYGKDKEVSSTLIGMSFNISNHVSSSATQTVINHKDQIIKEFGQEAFDKWVVKVNNNSMEDVVKHKDETMLKKIQDFISKTNIPVGKRISSENNLKFIEAKLDWIGYAAALNKHIKKYISKDAESLSNAVLYFEKNCPNDKALMMTEKSFLQMGKLKPSYTHHYAIARMYVKTKQNEKAKFHIKKAIELANGEDVNEAENLLKRITK
ncbi:MAG: hypothetical protein RLZZ546_1500 [Bacteroidota bacterium]|jgi:thiol-disulfide isomerase/thioredoxin